MRRLLLASLLLFLATGLYAQSLEVHFIDVGQGEAVFLETSDAAVLVDAGQSGEVADYLTRIGVEEIDLAIGTHAHADHIGGFPSGFETLEVSEAWYNGQEHTTRTFERFIDTLLDSDADYLEPKRGHTREFGDLSLRVLHPEGSAADHDGDLHDENIVVRADYHDFSVLLTGDAEERVERELIEERRELEATILKLGHHGSRTSTSSAFLEAVSPEVSVYQAGEDNRYGHPHEEVLSRIPDDVDVYGTDIHGTVVVETDGSDYEIGTERDGDIAAPACININSASAEELQEIIHIGEGRADSLIELRPFDSVEELTRISGIGPARIEDIQEQGIVCPVE